MRGGFFGGGFARIAVHRGRGAGRSFRGLPHALLALITHANIDGADFSGADLFLGRFPRHVHAADREGRGQAGTNPPHRQRTSLWNCGKRASHRNGTCERERAGSSLDRQPDSAAGFRLDGGGQGHVPTPARGKPRCEPTNNARSPATSLKGDDPAKPLRYPFDFAPFKPRA